MSDNPSPSPPHSGRWKPGQSGNPSGRPKSKPFKEALQAVIERVGLDGAAAALVARANTGDVAAIKEIGDRLDGKVPQSIGGSDELPPIQGFAWIDPISNITTSGTQKTGEDAGSKSPSTD